MFPQENTVRVKLKFKLRLPLSHFGLRNQETRKGVPVMVGVTDHADLKDGRVLIKRRADLFHLA